MITVETKNPIERVKVLSEINYLKMVQEFKARMDIVIHKRKSVAFNLESVDFIERIEICRDLKYSGISGPGIPDNFLVNGKDLATELCKLDKNPEVILACKDMIMWIIDIYLDLKVSLLLINQYFPMSDRNKISNALYIMLKGAISVDNESKNTNDDDLQRKLDAQIMTKSYFEKTDVVKEYYGNLNQKINDVLRERDSVTENKIKIEISDLKDIVLHMTDSNGIRFLQKFILPNLSAWILTKDGRMDKHLLLKPIFEIICPDWELNNMPKQGYRNENDYAWHKIDSMLKPDKFLKDLESRI